MMTNNKYIELFGLSAEDIFTEAQIVKIKSMPEDCGNINKPHKQKSVGTIYENRTSINFKNIAMCSGKI